MKKVLLTGASGFIGQHCLPLLEEGGYEIHAVSSKAQPLNIQTGVSWHRADLLDAAQVSKLMAAVEPTHLLHLAWYGVPQKFWTSMENFRWVQASLNLFEAFTTRGGRRIVSAGTCAEYDWQSPDGLLSERSTPLAPATLYGACKHALRLMLDAFARQSGVSAAWGRIFFLYGPGEHPERLVASVIRALIENRPASCTHGRQVRDFLYVDDVAAAFVALLESDVEGAVNIGSGEGMALKDVVYKIAEKIGRPDLIQLDTRPAPSGEPPLLLADVRRLREEVAWQPQYGIDLGLARTIRWWESQGKRAAGE